ncbi:hypothetical protein POM88_036515 [Heracleum sosnowskyi]|uniref:Cyclin N-terminal domain-containing protein n=1 Tax=Heracleum sosnowskyi TaxID=360622 RepID=A0AAD8HQ70_9APIA|nr:hypothetical protein POM88_036515 [Heracleum sosnowskyi]
MSKYFGKHDNDVEVIERKIGNRLDFSEDVKVLAPANQIVDVDVDDDENPGLCATMIREIYSHLKASEAKKRSSTDYMAKVQKEIDIRMRAILIDWLVEVVDVHVLDPKILYLNVNYIDRYLSGNPMNTERLQLLGITCMMIAYKHEVVYPLPLE